jgi:hypothetical protein
VHLDLNQRLRQRDLRRRGRLGLVQGPLLHGRLLLLLIGRHLFPRNLARTQLNEDVLDGLVAGRRARRADQHLLQFQRIGLESRFHFVARFLLDRGPVLQQFDQRHLLRDILEEGADHRVERLFDQLLDVAEALNDHRRLLVIDVHDDGERQRRLERVLGDERYLRKIFVEFERADFTADPFENEIDGGDDLDLAGVGIERVFAGQHGVFPDAAAAIQDKFAMAVLLAGDVGGLRPGIEDHHADIADRDNGLWNGLDGREQSIDVPGALDDDLQLAPAESARLQEFFRLLEVVVKRFGVMQVGADFRRDDFTWGQRWTVVDGDDANQVLVSGKA